MAFIQKYSKALYETLSVLLFFLVIGVLITSCDNIIVSSKTKKEEKTNFAKVDKLFQGYFYDEALSLLKSISRNSDNSDSIDSKIKQIEDAKNSLVKYEGPVHHVFFHSLIVYTDLAFNAKGNIAQGYNMWMTTASEFKKMLPELRKRGYVLYSLEDYIEKDPKDSTKIKLKDIMLPPGKIPLVISVDDVNYYPYMQNDGFASKLVIGKDGKVWTEVHTPEGKTEMTRNGDVVPILDDFVEEYPDFSFRGAKGVLALTGYEGALGYHYKVHDKDEVIEPVMAQAKKVAEVLKKDGWLFASHSYSHGQSIKKGTISAEGMKADTEKWLKYIGAVVGPTNIYISPFGVLFKKDDPRHRAVVDLGFNIYCSVGSDRRIYFNRDNIVMPRVNLDGYKLINRKEEVKKYYFDSDSILDSARPEFKSVSSPKTDTISKKVINKHRSDSIHSESSEQAPLESVD